jgi:Carboxypeptidase regulatory-like domain
MKLLGSLFWILLFAVPLAAQTAAVRQPEKCAIEGAVTRSGSGLPLDKVEITIDIKGAQEPPLVTTTDANGHFVVANLEPGHYSLRAERTGYVGQTYGQRKKNREGVILILGPGEKLRGIDFRLVATGVITGHVLGEDNEPIVGAYVQASEFRYSQGRRRLLEGGRASTNDLGEYRIYGLQPGHYYLTEPVKNICPALGKDTPNRRPVENKPAIVADIRARDSEPVEVIGR